MYALYRLHFRKCEETSQKQLRVMRWRSIIAMAFLCPSPPFPRELPTKESETYELTLHYLRTYFLSGWYRLFYWTKLDQSLAWDAERRKKQNTHGWTQQKYRVRFLVASGIFLISCFSPEFLNAAFVWCMVAWFILTGIDVAFITKSNRYKSINRNDFLAAVKIGQEPWHR